MPNLLKISFVSGKIISGSSLFLAICEGLDKAFLHLSRAFTLLSVKSTNLFILLLSEGLKSAEALRPLLSRFFGDQESSSVLDFKYNKVFKLSHSA